MKIFVLAFILSLLLHLLLFFTYQNPKKEIEEQKKEEIKKSEVKLVKLRPNIQKKDFSTQRLEKEQTSTINKEKKNKQSSNKKQIQKQEAKILQKKILKETSKFQEKTLEDFLSQRTFGNQEVLNELQKLYGEEYNTFTKVQKAFLEENLNHFQRITQRVLNRLGYPKLAAKLQIAGINIVEFIFHPNGDISDLKIISSSSYNILDEYTLELIQIAYKEYPKPLEATKLRFKVYYSIY